MANISQTMFSKEFSWMTVLYFDSNFIIYIYLKFVPKGPVDKKSALVQVMAWRQAGDKPLHESMLTRLYGALGADELIATVL